jgi:hypothetical protein
MDQPQCSHSDVDFYVYTTRTRNDGLVEKTFARERAQWPKLDERNGLALLPIHYSSLERGPPPAGLSTKPNSICFSFNEDDRPTEHQPFLVSLASQRHHKIGSKKVMFVRRYHQRLSFPNSCNRHVSSSRSRVCGPFWSHTHKYTRDVSVVVENE